jgi:hypothetical protein
MNRSCSKLRLPCWKTSDARWSLRLARFGEALHSRAHRNPDHRRQYAREGRLPTSGRLHANAGPFDGDHAFWSTDRRSRLPNYSEAIFVGRPQRNDGANYQPLLTRQVALAQKRQLTPPQMRCALNLTSSTHKHVGAQVCVEVFDLYDDTTPIPATLDDRGAPSVTMPFLSPERPVPPRSPLSGPRPMTPPVPMSAPRPMSSPVPVSSPRPMSGPRPIR